MNKETGFLSTQQFQIVFQNEAHSITIFLISYFLDVYTLTSSVNQAVIES